jgi:hypothetical protein
MQDVGALAVNKQFLRSIADKQYEIPDDIDCFAFAEALLANFSSPDEELRDGLSSMILASGIIDKQRLTDEQLRKLLLIALDNEHLFYRIGEVGTDSVFMRSFSNLIVAAILYTDARASRLPPEAVQQVKAALLRYAREEQDWRGYIRGKGWAHAMAHLADALDECAQHPAMSRGDREEIMKMVSALARLPEPLYHEEDVRLATVAYHIIGCKQVEDEFLSAWLQSCFVRRDADVRSWTRATNAKNFMRSLYFLLLWDDIARTLVDQIANILKRQDKIYIEDEAGDQG